MSTLDERPVDAGTELSDQRVRSEPASADPGVPGTDTSSNDTSAADRYRAGRLPHQPALDGVRGAAVAAVVLYHAAAADGVGWLEPWTRGGYLGVSAFFTLSGFLICSLLLRERRRSGSVSLAAFWERRARRLLPAAYLLIGAVVVLTPLVGTEAQLASLPGDAFASLFYVANWRFVLDGADYASMFSGAPSPLRHLWSLAVEEQWYLLVPLVAVVVARWAGRTHPHRRSGLAAALAVAVVLSTMWMIVVSGGAWDNRAYMGTDTRLAEMAVGALAAVLVARGLTLVPTLRRPLERIAPFLTVALLVAWALVPIRSGWLYRGGLTLHAVAVACVVLAAVQPTGVTRRVLSARWLAGLGKVSYGVYLFHWPIVWWMTPSRLGTGPTATLVIQVALTLGVSVLSFRLLESPVRRRRVLRSWRGVVAALAAMGAIILGVVALPEADRSAVVALGSGQRIAVPTTTVAEASGATDPVAASEEGSGGAVVDDPGTTVAEPPVAADAPGVATPSPAASPTTVPSPLPPLRVMVAGDSFAESVLIGLQRWGLLTGDAAVMDATVPACPFGRGGRNRGIGIPRSEEAQCENRDRMLLESMGEFDPDLVVLAGGLWDVTDRRPEGFGRWTRIGRPDYDEFLRSEMQHVLDVLTRDGARVLWADSPYWDPVPESVIFMGEPPYPEAETERVDLYNAMLADVVSRREGVELLDLAGWMRSQPGGEFEPGLRPDGVHFSEEGTNRVAEWLGPFLLTAGAR